MSAGEQFPVFLHKQQVVGQLDRMCVSVATAAEQAAAPRGKGIRHRLIGKLEPWQADGLCATRPDVTFFPDKGRNDQIAAAKAVCAECPVRAECLDYALRSGERFGVWGGKTDRDLRRLRLARDKRAAS